MIEQKTVEKILKIIDTKINEHVAVVAKTDDKRKRHIAFSIAAELTELKDDIEKLCNSQSDCSHCNRPECLLKTLESGSEQSQPQWVPVDFDVVDGKYSISEDDSDIPYFDYVSGMNTLVKHQHLSYSSVSFGGWFYNTSCSWHKSLVMKPDIPDKIRFWLYTCNKVQS